MMNDLISRQDAIEVADAVWIVTGDTNVAKVWQQLQDLPSAQPERYTKEELRVFQHGISLSLLSKRSAQHWQYDEDTATEIKFLERLYDKVSADMKGGQG